jgi:ornithine carbamoyltransferase
MDNFLHVNDLNEDSLNEILDRSSWVKAKVKEESDYKPLSGKSMAMIFAKPSARTRISFETGFYKLGGHALYLGPNDIGIGKRESVADIGRVISRFNDIIMARLFDHNHILELAEFSSVPVINGLTDFNHPCQIVADLFTIKEHLGRSQDFTISYVGDGNNIVHSWLELAMIIPFKLNIVCPEDYCPDLNLVNKAKDLGLSDIRIIHDPVKGVENSDIIYSDVWASMGQKEESDLRKKIFNPYQVNKTLFNSTGKDTLFMHCLPAERGLEVTDEICDASFSIIFDQAENRMHAQNAIILKLML